jgi:hypothetical protein
MDTKNFSTNPNIKKIDLENGEILEVSLITTGEILGHGMFLNEAGLDSFLECIDGTQVKAYYKHSDENEALSSIGFFENFQKKKKENGEYQIVGDFSGLNAWKDGNEKEYNTFFELAEKAPEVFGISVEALINSGFYNEEGELVMLDNEIPESQDTQIYAFCEKVLAWSVVSTPATNPNGLFSQKEKQFKKENITIMEEQITETEEVNPVEDLEAKVSQLEKELSIIMELAKELRDENESLSETNSEYEAQVEKLEAKVDSFDIGTEPLDHGFSSEKEDISETIKSTKDWNVKYKLVLENLHSFQIHQGDR